MFEKPTPLNLPRWQGDFKVCTHTVFLSEFGEVEGVLGRSILKKFIRKPGTQEVYFLVSCLPKVACLARS